MHHLLGFNGVLHLSASSFSPLFSLSGTYETLLFSTFCSNVHIPGPTAGLLPNSETGDIPTSDLPEREC